MFASSLFRSFLGIVALLLILCFEVNAQEKPYSQQMVDSFIANHKDSILVGNNTTTKWDYEQGLMLKAIEKVWNRTGDGKYFNYIQNDVNQYVGENGNIRTYKLEDFNIDNIPPGRALLTLYQQTLPDKEKYKKAADVLWSQLEQQPRTNEGGYWHKKRYPYQMWLDGLFMGEPFAAEYSKVFNHMEHFDDIAKQFALIEKHAVDVKTGLIYHAYDESRGMPWASPQSGLSPNFWSRAIGWYVIALVDVLDYFPKEHPKRIELINYLKRLAPVLANYQDKNSGLWYQVTDQGDRSGNYLEASASCMFVYALAKGVRMGYLPANFLQNAQRGFQGILKELVEKESDGSLSLNGTVSVGGLGGNPYRSGSFGYYIGEPIRKNDLKGIGTFIFASVEMEIAAENKIGKGKTVGLDNYFNHEFRKSITGEQETFHYLWNDRMHSGFSLFGSIFQELGADLTTITVAPTIQNLKDLAVYIIVDPDTKKETADPNIMYKNRIATKTDRVKKGGVIL